MIACYTLASADASPQIVKSQRRAKQEQLCCLYGTVVNGKRIPELEKIIVHIRLLKYKYIFTILNIKKHNN